MFWSSKYWRRKSNRLVPILMELSLTDCFDDDEREGMSSLSGNENRVYCPHCRETVHRSTFYRHKTKYLLDEPSESELFDGEFDDFEASDNQQESPRASQSDGSAEENFVDVCSINEVQNSSSQEVAS